MTILIKNMFDKDMDEIKAYTYELYEGVKNNAIQTLAHEVCIPTCHNRKPTILDNLAQFGETTINVFVYENELSLYKWLKNVNIVPVPVEYITIHRMRQFIQNYMGDKTYWCFDDDMRIFEFQNEKIKLNIAQGLKMIEMLVDEKNVEFTAIGPCVSPTAVYWNKNNKLIFENTTSRACLLYNGRLLRELGIHYTGDVDVHEDLEFLVNCLRAGMGVKSLKWIAFYTFDSWSTKNTIASTPELFRKYLCNDYLKFGSDIRLRVRKGRIYADPNVKNILNKVEKTWDEEIVNLCKNHDLDGVIEYIESKRK